MQYEGPIYRPPSEADSLLIQATVGCPHNRCTFCMVYKNGPPFKIRPVADIIADLNQASESCSPLVTTLFFPAGNTIAMKTEQLSMICRHAHSVFPHLQRITVYGSSQYIHQKGEQELRELAQAGLSRIHVGLESGDDVILQRVCKGTTRQQQIEAGRYVMEAGIELSMYVLLGIGGVERSFEHAQATAFALNAINPTYIRLRTFLPKIHTPMLEDVEAGVFQMLGPHGVLRETREFLTSLDVTSQLTSDHYTNYVNIFGQLPHDTPRMLKELDLALQRAEGSFRPVYIGTQ
ncbi:radical SAM protein [Desulfogranum japonicum]|uniref:radical SAM protein n=1 Tax=Desulfogranum japonicum TaxID=231447 RepID=UPI00041FAF35|nr:radical SAM protein [Desulfogranum japonicum]